jgi:signal transduction histidine kinase
MGRLRGLQAQILFWAILPLIIVLVVVSFGSITLHQQSMRQMVADRDAQIAALAAGRLDNGLQERALALRTLLIDTASAQGGQPNPAHPLLADFDGGVTLRRADGSVLPLSGSAAPDAAPFQAALAHPNTPAYSLSLSADINVMVDIAVADPATRWTALGRVSGQAIGLNDILRQLGSQGYATAVLVGQDGRVLFDPNRQEIGMDMLAHAGVREALAGRSGSAFAQFPGQPEHVVGYAPVAATGWGLIVEEPWQDVIVPLLQYTLLTPLIVLAAAVASLLAVYFGLRRIVRPLQALGRQSSRLAWGDFVTITHPVGGIDEIRELQRTLQEMAGQIQRSQAAMQDYIAALTQTQEDERQRLARELHDETVQSLIALGQRVKMLALDLADGDGRPLAPQALPAARQRVAELNDMLTHTLAEVRGLIRNLRPIYLEELGLVAAIEMLVESARHSDMRQTGRQATFEVSGEERRLKPEVEMAAYRIAQEGLSNVTRHAHASTVNVRLEYIDEGITVTVEDNGAGFQPPEMPSDLAAQGHFGLLGMYERATRLGGHFSVRSTPHDGTRIIAFLPG